MDQSRSVCETTQVFDELTTWKRTPLDVPWSKREHKSNWNQRRYKFATKTGNIYIGINFIGMLKSIGISVFLHVRKCGGQSVRVGEPMSAKSVVVHSLLKPLQSHSHPSYWRSPCHISCQNHSHAKTSTLTLHLLLFFIRKHTIINAKLKLINAKIHSCYSIDIH